MLFLFRRSGQIAKELECQAKQFMTESFMIGNFVHFGGMPYILSFWKCDMESQVPALQPFFMQQKSN